MKQHEREMLEKQRLKAEKEKAEREKAEREKAEKVWIPLQVPLSFILLFFSKKKLRNLWKVVWKDWFVGWC